VTRYNYNDEESFSREFAKVKSEVAAVLVEGVLGHAGSAPPTKSFLQTVREETEKSGVAMIIDEVVTGFRVARGGISQRLGVEPDGVALGKIIGGGFPVGAFLGEEKLMRSFEYSKAEFPGIGKPVLQQAGTFNAHAVTMAAGLATLNVLTTQAYDRLEQVGNEVRKVLARLGDEHGVPRAVTGIASMFMFHFSDIPTIDSEETAQHSDEKKGRLFDALMLDHGVLMPAFHSAFCSLPMGRAQVSEFEKAADASFSDMKRMGEL
jgi:glutamate-1-semialdehyde 2,1-aminomutase